MPELKLDNSLVDDRYEVRERLGLGSYAEIWVARDHQLAGREVVLKALNTSLQGTPEADLERTLVENFQNEAIALDTVRHPHIILRLGHGTAADLRGVPFHYLVLEYLSGGDLLRYARQQRGSRLSLERALQFLQQVCEALAYAHSHGIIHRDLKPNNLLLTADTQTLKVADFGVAKLGTDEISEITRVGAGVYAPPEHHPTEAGGRVERLTAAADIYSLAKSVYTILCGRAPSQYVCAQITALPDDIRREPWAAPLLQVLQRATAPLANDRYATVIEFWSELANIATFGETRDLIALTGGDEETQIRPRLENLSAKSFEVPTTPPQPDFNPVLASSGALDHQPTVAALAAEGEAQLAQAAVPAAFETDTVAVPLAAAAAAVPAGADFSGRKIVVGLPNAMPSVAAIASPPTNNFAAPALPQPQSAGQMNIAAKSAAAAAPRAAVRAEQRSGALGRGIEHIFLGNWQRRLVVSVLLLGFLLGLVGVYRYVSRTGLPVPTGDASQIEVLSQNLNVRSGPSQQSSVVGVVSKGTTHRVIGGNEESWLQIEVSKWNDAEFPHVDGQTAGWIYLPNNAKVIARRWQK